jgi:hypothetical protein
VNCAEEACCAVDGWVEEVGLVVGHFEVEGGGCVDHSLEWWVGFDGVIEGAFCGDVFDYYVGDGLSFEEVLQVLALLVGADSDDYFVPRRMLEASTAKRGFQVPAC